MSESFFEALSSFKNATFQDKVYGGLNLLRLRGEPAFSQLNLSELRIFSQNGEDGVLYDLWRLTDAPSWIVAIGSGDGWSSNSRLWIDVFGWNALLLEADTASYEKLVERYRLRENVMTKKAFVSPDNVNDILQSSGVPHDFGILDIDIDGQDYWIWKALNPEWRPRVVVCEYNSGFGDTEVMAETQGHNISNLTRTWGCSISSLRKLGLEKGYTLIYQELAGVNAFFVRNDLIQEPVDVLPRTPNYGLRGFSHPDSVLFQFGPSEDRPTTHL